MDSPQYKIVSIFKQLLKSVTLTVIALVIQSLLCCVSTSAATSATNVLPVGCMSLLRDPNITSGDSKYNRSHAVGAFSSCTGSRETLKETDLNFSLLVLPFRSTCRFRIIRITSPILCSGTPCRSKFVSLLHLS